MQNQIVQDVEIAEALLDSYLKSTADANPSMLRLAANQDISKIAIGTAEQIFPEIWRRLDAARAAASTSGRDLSHYDSIREHLGLRSEAGITSFSTIRVRTGPFASHGITVGEGNAVGARAARDAIGVFRATFADHPWHSTNEPVPELRSGRKLALVIAIVGGAVVAAGIIGLMYFRTVGI